MVTLKKDWVDSLLQNTSGKLQLEIQLLCVREVSNTCLLIQESRKRA